MNHDRPELPDLRMRPESCLPDRAHASSPFGDSTPTRRGNYSTTVSTKAAVWIAFGLGLAVLAVQGVVFARVERLGWPGTLLVVAANLSLGAVLVALKVLVTH
jgi:hypothetical protein